MPLNPTLYGLLRQEFSNVRIAHEGDAMTKQYVVNYDVDPPRLKLATPEHGCGEYYRVNCPYCYDTRGRLWINHLWGVWDPIVQSYNLWLGVCYNQMCLQDPDVRQDLFKRIYSFKNVDQRSDPIEILPGKIEEPLREVTYPGDWILLKDLNRDHRAVQYLWSRGYDYETFEKYKLAYCERALPEYRAAEDRIIIPVFMYDLLVGWQCRYIGEEDWKNTYIPKYYNMPGMKRRQILYNYDTAKAEPYVVLVEGVTSAWNLGNKAVSLLGSSLAKTQLEAIIGTWRVAVILMDGDEAGREATQTIYDDLRRYITCIKVKLPEGRDPAGLDREFLWMLIKSQAKSEGLDLDALTKEGTGANSTAIPALRGTGGTDSAGSDGGSTGTEVDGRGPVPNGPPHRPRYAAPRSQLHQAGGKH